MVVVKEKENTLLTDLTPQRKEIISKSYNRWLENGLRTDQADFETAEIAITKLYKSIGKKKPYFVKLNSPLAAELYINLYSNVWPDTNLSQLWDQLRGQLGGQLRGQLRGQLWDQLRGQLWDQLGGQLRGQLRDQLGDQLRGQLGGQLWDQLWDQLGGQLRDQLGDQLRDQLGDQLRGQLWDQLRGQLGDQLWGQLGDQLWGQLRDQLGDAKLKHTGTWFWGNWESIWPWLSTGRDLGVRYTQKENEQLDCHLDIMESIGWWYPFEDFVILTDRPSKISLNEEGALSAEKGAALQYRDGYKLFFLDGISVPEKWIEQGFPSAHKLLQWENADQRAVGCKYAGWHNLLDGLNAEVIERHESPIIGTLFGFTFEGRQQRCLVYICPSDPSGKRVMSALVDPSLNSVFEASAWHQNITEEQLSLMEGRA